MTTLAEIENAVATLPRDQIVALYEYLRKQLQTPTPARHGVLDIPPVQLGSVLRPFENGDLLDDCP